MAVIAKIWLFSLLFFTALTSATDLLFLSTMTGRTVTQATALGFTYTVVTESQWSAMSTIDFMAYKAIIIADSQGNVNTLTILDTTKAVWSPAVTGKVLLLGTDESYHANDGIAGAAALIDHGLNFTASGGSAGTGLYLSISNDYRSATTLSFLSEFGTFSISPAPGCFNNVHIVASSPALGTLTDADLSNWSCSIHEVFDSYPKSGVTAFQALAIANALTGVGSSSFADGSTGTAYILARGVTPSGCGNGVWNPTFGEECDSGSANNGAPGDPCTETCKCVSGRPMGDGTCLPPYPSSTTTTILSLGATPYTSTYAASSTFGPLIVVGEDPESTTTTTLPAGETPYTSTISASGTLGPLLVIGVDAESTTTTTLTPGGTPFTSTISASGTLGPLVVIGVDAESTAMSTSTDAESTAMSTSTDPENTTMSTSADPESTTASTSADPESTTASTSADPENTTMSTSADPENTTMSTSADPESTTASTSADPENTTMSTSADPGRTTMSTSADPESTTASTSTDPENTTASTSADPQSTNMSTSTGSESSATSTTISTASPATTTSARLTFIVKVEVMNGLGGRANNQLYGSVNADGTVSLITDCGTASLLTVANGTISFGSLVGFASPAALVTGSEPFNFGPSSPTQIQTDFSYAASKVTWNNAAFANGDAIFALNPTTNQIEVFYAGDPPIPRRVVVLRIVFGYTVPDACASIGALSTTSSSSTSALMSSPSPGVIVGVEIIILVEITLIYKIINGIEVCSTLTRTASQITNPIYNCIVPNSPCYVCQLEKQAIPYSTSCDLTVTRTSCIGDSPPTDYPLVVKVCSTCSPTNLGLFSNLASTLLGTAVYGSNPILETASAVISGKVVYGLSPAPSAATAVEVVPTSITNALATHVPVAFQASAATAATTSLGLASALGIIILILSSFI